jgi:hypothetical protein
MALDLVKWIQMRNYRAYRSHRKRKTGDLTQVAL